MDCITDRNDLKYCFIIALILLVPAVSAYNPELSGDRNLGQEYRFTVKNVTAINQNLPGSDVTYHWTVYDYRLLGQEYTYYSPNWGQWFRKDADTGKQFLAVWVKSELTGNTSWYGWGSNRFSVWVWDNTTVNNESTHMEDLPLQYNSDRYRPVVIAEVQDLMSRDKKLLSREWFGWKDEIELTRQDPGPSATWDGIILYQIPDAATGEDLRVVGTSWYGYGVWHLTNKIDLIQGSYTMGTDTRNAVKVVEPIETVIRGKNKEEEATRKTTQKPPKVR